MMFDKYKVRVVTRGDKQWNTGVTEGPVIVHAESLFMLLSIAAFEKYKSLKSILDQPLCTPLWSMM